MNKFGEEMRILKRVGQIILKKVLNHQIID